MNKILMTLSAILLSACLFAQTLPKDFAKLRLFYSDAVSELENNLNGESAARQKQEFKKKIKEEKFIMPVMTLRQAVALEELNKELKREAELKLFTVFVNAVRSAGTDDITAVFKEYEETLLDKNNKIDAAVFKNIKTFYEKSLVAKDSKTAFLEYAAYDYCNKTDEITENSYNLFFAAFVKLRQAQINTKAADDQASAPANAPEEKAENPEG
ncbi:MAG: hypothetical protein FWF35_03645 [Elusimicrobia bacterium]|nr:hypothetical protein [Elusimicrobiota bacterium]